MKLSKKMSFILISTLLFTFNSNLHITTYATEMKSENRSQQVTFKINGQWEGAFIGEILITNTSATTLSNWELQFALPHNISSIYNAKLSQAANLYTLGYEDYNSTIYPNQTISIGFIANYDTDITLPKDYVLKSNGEIIEPQNTKVFNPPFFGSIKDEIAYYKEIAPDSSKTDEIIVKFNDSSSIDSWIDELNNFYDFQEVSVSSYLKFVDAYVLKFASIDEADIAIDFLNQFDAVYHAEPNYIRDIMD